MPMRMADGYRRAGHFSLRPRRSRAGNRWKTVQLVARWDAEHAAKVRSSQTVCPVSLDDHVLKRLTCRIGTLTNDLRDVFVPGWLR
jgi:hypothetical protein